LLPAHVLKACAGAELQLHQFLTSTVDAGLWAVSTPCRFTNGKRALVPIEFEASWAPELVWVFWKTEKLLVPLGDRSTIPQP